MKKAFNAISRDEYNQLNKNFPDEEWVCKTCRYINNTWLVNTGYVCGSSDIKYKKGFCKNCRDIQAREAKEKEDELIMVNQKLKSEKLLAESGLAERIIRVNSDKMITPENKSYIWYKRIMSEIEEVRDRPEGNRWFYIYGQNSTGKTYLMENTVKRLVYKGIPVLYINENRFFDKIKDSWESKEIRESDIYKMFEKANVIFWDEFMFYNYTKAEWKYERLYKILDYLTESNKTVVFCSNVRVEHDKYFALVETKELMNRVGLRPLSRLKRNNLFVVNLDNDPFF